jgi:HSP20 family protein
MRRRASAAAQPPVIRILLATCTRTHIPSEAAKEPAADEEEPMTFLTRFERWDPFEELTTLRTRMDRLWSRMSAEDAASIADWSPTSDVIESKDEIVIKAELPGIDEKKVDVEIENGVLTIKGERNAEKEPEEKGFRRVERSYGSFLRSFTLPASVEPEKVSATFTNGLLEVHLPKKEGAKPRSIKVDVKKQLAPAA